MSASAPVIMLEDRRSPLAPTRTVSLYRDRIDLSEKDALARRIDLGAVTEVRLTVEPAPGAGTGALVVCRVRAGSGEIAFGSRRLKPGGGWSDEGYAFRKAIIALHQALRPRASQIAFREGPSFRTRLILCAAGLAMTLAALGFAGYMLLDRQAGLLAVMGAPFALIGGAIAWMYRPRADEAYDPDALIQRFSGKAADRA